MQVFNSTIKGDKVIWVIALLLAIFSFMPVFSASTNLAYVAGSSGNTTGYLIKHAMHLFLGFLVLYFTHKLPHKYFAGFSKLLMPICILLLIVVLISAKSASGETLESRWLRVPGLGISFQPSAFASVVLFVYVAAYLSKIQHKAVSFKESILPLWIPTLLVVGLVFLSNLSTAVIIFSVVLMLCFIGGYPSKYLLKIVGIGALAATLFILSAKAMPSLFPNRVDTWISRIESFAKPDEGNRYQADLAKTAIALGGQFGVGPGKSTQKYVLPQSSSDFIYAIIVEEFGLVGGIAVLLAYFLLLFRMLVIATKAKTVFARLLVVGVGLPIIFQALINMGVAVSLFPVTGQTLPLISSGGTSIWMTCLALGIVLSVSSFKYQETEQEPVFDEENPLEILSETI